MAKKGAKIDLTAEMRAASPVDANGVLEHCREALAWAKRGGCLAETVQALAENAVQFARDSASDSDLDIAVLDPIVELLGNHDCLRAELAEQLVGRAVRRLEAGSRNTARQDLERAFGL